MTPESIVRSLDSGSMKTEGVGLSADEREAIAEFLTHKNVAAAGPTVSGRQFMLGANPHAASGLTGTGLLGQMLRIPESLGVHLGGLLNLDGNWLVSGGVRPNSISGNLVLGLSLSVDTEKALHIPGGEFRAEYLEFDGMNTNGDAGSVQLHNSLTSGAPYHRHQLFKLWWRQRFFHDKLFVKAGKINGTSEFCQVLIPVPVSEPQMQDWTISNLVYAPAGINPTLFGRLPGYPDTAYGVTASFTPVKNVDFSYGIFDGNAARFVQTGLNNTPEFNGYQFHIGEVGYVWRLSDEGKPGRIGAGVWRQTGKLVKPDGTYDDGAAGYYFFGSQRLWYKHSGLGPSGVTAFAQYGHTGSQSSIVMSAVNGGLTAIGLVPGRPADSMGMGVAWARLNPMPGAGAIVYPDVPSTSTSLRPHELMWQAYYQAVLIPWRLILEGACSSIPTPGYRPDIPWARALTARLIVMF
jgi:porin